MQVRVGQTRQHDASAQVFSFRAGVSGEKLFAARSQHLSALNDQRRYKRLGWVERMDMRVVEGLHGSVQSRHCEELRGLLPQAPGDVAISSCATVTWYRTDSVLHQLLQNRIQLFVGVIVDGERAALPAMLEIDLCAQARAQLALDIGCICIPRRPALRRRLVPRELAR